MCHPPTHPTGSRPAVSFLVRGACRQALGRTIARVETCGLRAGEFEVLVLESGPSRPARRAPAPSAAPDVRASHFPVIHLMAPAEPGRAPWRTTPRGGALAATRGELIVLLEEDCGPRPGSLAGLCDLFEADAELAAAIFTVFRADGTREPLALPGLVRSAGTALRRSALERAGGLPTDVSPSAEEFELSLRLLATGGEIKSFDSLQVTRLHAPTAADWRRRVARDAYDAVTLPARYFPRPYAALFAREWLRQCRRMADAHGCRGAYRAGRLRGRLRTLGRGRRRPVSLATFERLTLLEETERRLRRAQDRYRLTKLLLVDLGKTTPIFWLAAERCGIKIVAVADAQAGDAQASDAQAGDARPGGGTMPGGGRYRGVPVLPDELVVDLDGASTYDAALVGDLCPHSAAARRDAWRHFSRRPVIDLYEDDSLAIRPYAPRFRVRRPPHAPGAAAPASREELAQIERRRPSADETPEPDEAAESAARPHAIDFTGEGVIDVANDAFMTGPETTSALTQAAAAVFPPSTPAEVARADADQVGTPENRESVPTPFEHPAEAYESSADAPVSHR